MSKEFKQQLKEFVDKSFVPLQFSKTLIKQAEQCVNFANRAFNEKLMTTAETKEYLKETEAKEIKKLLKRAKTDAEFGAYERALWEIYSSTRMKNEDSSTFERIMEIKDLSMCLQVLSETHDEKKTLRTVSSLWDFIARQCSQSVNDDYLRRTISKATTLLEAGGKKIEHFPEENDAGQTISKTTMDAVNANKSIGEATKKAVNTNKSIGEATKKVVNTNKSVGEQQIED